MGLLESISKIFKKEQAQTVLAKKAQSERGSAAPRASASERKKTPKKSADQLALADWKTELDKLTQHPLTQAKIINEQLLRDLYNLLEQIDGKLDVLNAKVDKAGLAKQDGIKAELASQEQKILDLAQNRITANEISDELEISRSNASLKLNKLFDMGLLEKEQDGKTVYYQIKEIK
ncbi:MAG: helix-turn-helix domain-containing protein [Nanoarchaeota archaeon]